MGHNGQIAASRLRGVPMTPWDISTGNLRKSFDVTTRDDIPEGMYISSDGTHMYMAGNRNDLVHQWDITDGAPDTAVWVRSFNGTADGTGINGLRFKSDGTKMYIQCNSADEINQYDLSTAWNISTASYVGRISYGSSQAWGEGFHLTNDGTRMYVVGYYDRTDMYDVAEWNLSTAWDITTATIGSKIDLDVITGRASGCYLKEDGTHLYVTDGLAGIVYDWTLSTAWDVTTLGTPVTTNLGSKNLTDIQWTTDGSTVYLLNDLGDYIEQWG